MKGMMEQFVDQTSQVVTKRMELFVYYKTYHLHPHNPLNILNNTNDLHPHNPVTNLHNY